MVGLLVIPYPNQGTFVGNFVRPCCGRFAVSTYATVSMVFWYVGMVPDFATIRDRAKINSDK